MKVLKRLQNMVERFIPHKRNQLLQEASHSPDLSAEPTNIKGESKYEQLTEDDKERVDIYLSELMEGWKNDLTENPLSRIINFTRKSGERFKELHDCVIAILIKIDENSKNSLFTDGNKKIRECVELKLWMEVLKIYDKLLQDIEKETELIGVALTEFEIRLENSQPSNILEILGEKEASIREFKGIIDRAKKYIEICQLNQLSVRDAVAKEYESCRINTMYREISIITQGLEFKELEKETLDKLLKEILEKQHILFGEIEDLPVQEITPKYLAQCYAKLEKNKKTITEDLIKKIEELNLQIEEIKKIQSSLYQARQEQIQRGMFVKSPYENKDYFLKLKEDLMPKLKELEDKYKAMEIVRTPELKWLLYEVKFKVLTLTGKSYFKSYFELLQKENEKDNCELEVYRQIILRKAKQICDGENSNINRWFGEEKSKDIINFIKKTIKDKKGNIDIDRILGSSDLLSLILAFDSDYGIEMIEVPELQMEKVSQIDKGVILKSNISISSIFELYNIEKDFLEQQGLTLENFIDLNNPLMQIYYQYFMYSKKESSHSLNDGILYLPEGISKIIESSNLAKVLSEKRIERMVCPSTLYSIERYGIVSHYLKRIILNEGLIYIGDYAFFECDSLTEYNAPQTLSKIGEGAFSGCKNLQRISLNEGLKSIGNYAFEECSRLVEVFVPKTVTDIGRDIFDGCNEIKSTCNAHILLEFDTK